MKNLSKSRPLHYESMPCNSPWRELARCIAAEKVLNYIKDRGVIIEIDGRPVSVVASPKAREHQGDGSYQVGSVEVRSKQAQ